MKDVLPFFEVSKDGGEPPPTFELINGGGGGLHREGYRARDIYKGDREEDSNTKKTVGGNLQVER